MPCTLLSGSPGMVWVGFRREALTWIGAGGEPTWYSTWPTLHRGFCPHCGTRLGSLAETRKCLMVTTFSLTEQSGLDPVGRSFR
ncbi:GFA family protein [Streptomyces flaveolus]|uniref:GFA family protein n=1 Tax=Streptomyces flaveolus TaxID=67297 RepID=UPI00341E64E0